MICKNCGKQISKEAIRCKPCSNKYRKSWSKKYRCQICQKEFNWKDTRGKVTCSKKCHSIFMHNKYLGKGNPNYKGSPPRKEWAEHRIMTAHITSCEICNKTNNLETHHKDGNPKNNNINNLIKLCRRCHMLQDGRLKNLNYRKSNTGLCKGDKN